MAKKKTEKKVDINILEEDVEVVEEIEPTQEEIIQALEDEIKTLKNELLKQHANLENTRKRLEKERIIERKYAALPITKQILTPLDNFELALRHVIDNEAVQQFAQGFEMIKTQFTKALAEQGVSEIDALNEEYDPNFHQAIMTEKIEGVEPNIVIDVLQKGFMFKDRIIRPAMVKISE